MIFSRNQMHIMINNDTIRLFKKGSNNYCWEKNTISTERVVISNVAEASQLFREMLKKRNNPFFSPRIKVTVNIEYEGGLTDLEIQALERALKNAGAGSVLINSKINS